MEFAESATELRRKLSGIPGTYTLLQGESTNGEPVWESSDGGKYAIWWMAAYTQWYIGETKYRGKPYAELLSPRGHSSPVDRGMKWKRADIDKGKWMPPTNDISVICSSGPSASNDDLHTVDEMMSLNNIIEDIRQITDDVNSRNKDNE